MTAYTARYKMAFLEVGQGLADTRDVLEDNARTTEAALGVVEDGAAASTAASTDAITRVGRVEADLAVVLGAVAGQQGANGNLDAAVAGLVQIDSTTARTLLDRLVPRVDLAKLTGTSGVVDQLTAAGFPALNPDAPAYSNYSSATTGSPGPFGATSVVYDYNTAAVRHLGAYLVATNVSGTNYMANQATGVTGAGAKPWSFEFVTTSADLAIGYRRNAVSTDAQFIVWVDGRPTSRRPYSVGGMQYLRLTWPDSRRRVIRVEMARADFRNVTVPAGQSITATTVPFDRVKCALVGDSWFAGSAAQNWPNNTARIIERLTGWECLHAHIAGTGYTTTAATAYGAASRLTPVVGYAPDLILASGSINDSGASAAAVQSAATALYQSWATSLPTAKVLVVGPQPTPPSYLTNTAYSAVRDAVKAAAAAAPNVLGFIDPIAARWFTGTGNAAHPAGDGNADFYADVDNIHPTRQGAAYYARRVVAESVRLLELAAVPY